MGQRLNVQIENDDQVLANSYYHWSAYTYDSYLLTKLIVEAYENLVTPIPDLLCAIRLLQSTGAGINGQEKVRIQDDPQHRFDHINFPECLDRNRGILAVTEDGMAETESWEEGRVTINLSSQTINFNVISFYDPNEYRLEYENEEYAEWYPSYDEMRSTDIDISSIPFRDLYKLGELLEQEDPVKLESDGMVMMWIQ